MNLHNNNSTIGIHWQNWRCNRLQSKSAPWCSPQPLIFLLNKIRSFAATKFLANAETWVFSGLSKVVVYLVWYGMVEPHVSAPLLVDVRFSSDLLLWRRKSMDTMTLCSDGMSRYMNLVRCAVLSSNNTQQDSSIPCWSVASAPVPQYWYR
jgi:hypothetical protein